jgi:hypothetical protein
MLIKQRKTRLPFHKKYSVLWAGLKSAQPLESLPMGRLLRLWRVRDPEGGAHLMLKVSKE